MDIKLEGQTRQLEEEVIECIDFSEEFGRNLLKIQSDVNWAQNLKSQAVAKDQAKQWQQDYLHTNKLASSYQYIGLFFCADWCPCSSVWADLLCKLKANFGTESLHKPCFQFIIVPMSGNHERYFQLCLETKSLMIHTTESMLISNLISKYNDSRIVPLLVLFSDQGILLSKDELPSLLNLADKDKVKESWERYRRDQEAQKKDQAEQARRGIMQR